MRLVDEITTLALEYPDHLVGFDAVTAREHVVPMLDNGSYFGVRDDDGELQGFVLYERRIAGAILVDSFMCRPGWAAKLLRGLVREHPGVNIQGHKNMGDGNLRYAFVKGRK